MQISEIKNHHIARVLLLVLGVVVCLGAFYSFVEKNFTKSATSEVVTQNNRTIPPHTAMVTIREKTFFAELATTDSERTKGLGGRASLAENSGMLFVFEQPDKYSFWMKDTLIPLDMIWISADKKIVYIAKNVQPDSYPNLFSPDTDALYVLELAGGESDKNLLEVGYEVSF